MLTSDLVRARRVAGALKVQFLDSAARARLGPVADAYVKAYASLVGETRTTVDAALAAVEVSARDRPVALGLAKLCEDRAEFEAPGGLDPEVVREELFTRAAAAHRASTARSRFAREPIVRATAESMGVSSDDVERAMFADLRDNQRLTRFDALSVEELLDRYDVGLVQALLLRATYVELEAIAAPAAAVRRIFRAARFFGLLYAARPTARGTLFRFDGPLSLFEAAQKYGIKLAMFFPRILELPEFALTAEIRYGAAREVTMLRLDHTAGLKGRAPAREPERPEITALVEAFDALGSKWKIKRAPKPIAIPGEALVAPDLAFTHEATGEEVLFELFGFWSRAAVFQRIETIQRGFPGRILLAVGKQLRVSPELLEGDENGSILVFRTSISAKEVLARLDGPAGRDA
ncbi:MAG: DUF790 family protein [Polyangiaceae bacterium]